MARRANPAFAGGAVGVPLVALVYAMTVAPQVHHLYIHVMAGMLWTGFDVMMGMVFGPVVAGLDERARADFFSRFTPKTTFLLPMLAIVSIAAGIDLALRMGYFTNAGPWLALFTLVNLPGALLLIGWQFDAWTDPRWAVPFGLATVGSLGWVALTIGDFAMTNHVVAAALGLVTILNLQGFGLIFPGEVRVYLEMTGPDPDESVIAAVGQRNAKLAGVQGLVQFTLIVTMVYMRWP
jgi:hypothetical protein